MKTSGPLVLLLVLASSYARADAPSPPKWLMEVTRVAYTDLSNSAEK
jgi:hypothetical protein